MEGQKFFDIDLIFITFQPNRGYEVEFRSRHNQATTLIFPRLEGIEFKAARPMEVRSAFLQLSDQTRRTWNLRLDYPVNLKILELDNLIIEIL